MVEVAKVISTEVVAKNQITKPVFIVNKSVLGSIKRIIEVFPISQSIIYEFVRNNDLIQSANELTGNKFDKVIDWDDTTYNSYSVSINAVSSGSATVYIFDLGHIYDFILYIKFEQCSSNTSLYVRINISVSDDNVTYSSIYSSPETTSSSTLFIHVIKGRGRYIKISILGDNADTSSQTATLKIYSLQIFEQNNENNAVSIYTLTTNKFNKYEVITRDEKVMVFLDTNNAYYRVIDVDELERDYTFIDVE